jgi:hypothetical protein
MGLPTMLQRKDFTVPLPQSLHDLDKYGLQRVDRLVACTTLTMVMDEIVDAGYVADTVLDLARDPVITNMDT